MYQDYKDLLSAFQSHGVKYLVVGGFAVIYHSQPRFTKDMDLFIKADPDNAEGDLCRACRVWRTAPRHQLRTISPTATVSFVLGATRKASIFFRPSPALILTPHGNGALKVVDTATGLKANFISADDLIASKLASGRPQDLADADAIRKAIEINWRDAKTQPPNLDSCSW